MEITIDGFAGLIADRYGVDKQNLLSTDSFEELGFDSLTLYSIVGEVENRFNVQIETDDITQINTLTGMYKYVSSY